MKRALAERAKQSAGLPGNSGGNSNGGLLQVQAPTIGNAATPGSPRSHSLSPDSSYLRDHGRPMKIPRRTNDGPEAATSSAAVASQGRSSSTAGPSVPATSVSSSGNRQNMDVIRIGAADAVPSNSASGAAPIRVKSSSPATVGSQSNTTAGSTTGATTTTQNSPPSMKRQRPVSTKMQHPTPSDDDNDESQQSSFFLKHQNRALASELKALQYQLLLLEHERSYRRKQCRIASQALNSLQATWTQMETELQQQPQQQHQITSDDSALVEDTASYVEQGAPMSTGTGSRVELVGALFGALAALATTVPPPTATRTEEEMGEDEDPPGTTRATLSTSAGGAAADLESAEKQQLDDISNISWNILQRANTLEQWIRSLLQKVSATSNNATTNTQNGEDNFQDFSSAASADHRNLVKESGILRGQCREYKIQIAELAKARDDTAKSERKVRRSIYRLATGRVKIEQVLKDLEKSDEDGTLAAEAKMEALVQENNVAASASTSQRLLDAANASASQDNAEDGNLTAESGCALHQEVQLLRKHLDEYEKKLENRDNDIQELQAKLTEREQRINALCARELSEDDAEKVLSHQKAQKRLDQAEEELVEIKEKLKETRENWAKARGDADAALKALDELQIKQKKRWAELTGANEQSSETADEINLPLNIEAMDQSQKIIELDHKLKQALENVRQADAVRQNLKEALAMNSSLQGKLDEIKGKYAALQAGRSNSSSNSKFSGDAANHGSSSNQREKSGNCEKSESSSSKPEKSEKVHREHRRLRKELAALAASKDAAKSKLERVEKERDVLLETNARLLKQSAEKDDMNAKSLSTILHLKNLTEQLTQGKVSLEQQLKSAGQLSLASRLATNAKDRVAEEVIKEKEAIAKKLKECEGRNHMLKKELESTVSDWSEADAKISILNSQLLKATKRSDELVLELEREQKERRKSQDRLNAALQKADDATEKLGEIVKREGVSIGGTDSTFTVEQLNTQVSVLKGRLACPVCHYRDKDCIIMRCRHMFCKHCVEENIQNRSRKCPSCGLKFSEKDVDDVWL